MMSTKEGKLSGVSRGVSGVSVNGALGVDMQFKF